MHNIFEIIHHNYDHIIILKYSLECTQFNDILKILITLRTTRQRKRDVLQYLII